MNEAREAEASARDSRRASSDASGSPDPTPAVDAIAGISRGRIVLRVALWFFLAVSIFLFIAIMFGGLSGR